MVDKAKYTEMDVPTEKNNDNEKLITTTNDDVTRRSTRHKSQRIPYATSMGSEIVNMNKI